MYANVNRKACIQCGLCPSICPEVFSLSDGEPARAGGLPPDGAGGRRQLPHRRHLPAGVTLPGRQSLRGGLRRQKKCRFHENCALQA